MLYYFSFSELAFSFMPYRLDLMVLSGRFFPFDKLSIDTTLKISYDKYDVSKTIIQVHFKLFVANALMLLRLVFLVMTFRLLGNKRGLMEFLDHYILME